MPQKNIKRSIAMSEEMHALLTQIAAKHGRDITESHLIREAIRQFLDEQVDTVGSRRHFQKSLQLRLDRLERSLVFQMNVLVYLLAAILADDNAVDEAIIAAKRDGAALLAQIEAIRDLKDES
jgi:Arc/MetJ-type ribon-helix-helix transcriptional regulator